MPQFVRVREYTKLEAEDKDDVSYPEEGGFADDATHVIAKSWPATGEIEFRNVTIRYDLDGPNILTDINLKFKAGERVAVIGRTGSGKSTVSGRTALSQIRADRCLSCSLCSPSCASPTSCRAPSCSMA